MRLEKAILGSNEPAQIKRGDFNLDHRALINRPKTKKGRETLNRIVSAAAQEFYEKGYHNASINDITRRAGVASGTFYVYFDGKYNLYRFLLLQCSHMIRKHLNQAIQGCATRRKAEEVGLREWLHFVRENRYMYHIIWESLYIDKQLFDDFYTTFSNSYITRLRQAQTDGEVKDIDPNVLSYILMGITNFVALNSLVLKQEKNIDYLVDEVMKVLESGMFS